MEENENVTAEWYVEILRSDCQNECQFEFEDSAVIFSMGGFALFVISLTLLSVAHKTGHLKCIDRWDLFNVADDEQSQNILFYGFRIALCVTQQNIVFFCFLAFFFDFLGIAILCEVV